MMRHPWRRASAWILAALLTFVVAEPFRVHECPIHLRLAAQAAGGAHAAHAAADAAPAADHGTEHGQGHADDRGSTPDAPAHRCDCLGNCGLATLATLRPHPALWVPAAVAAVDGPPAREQAPAPGRQPHVLPFANGPPAVA